METIEELRQELERQRRRYEESEARARQAEARAALEKQRRELAEKAVAATDFNTFLGLCHNKLKTDLVIQVDPALAASGKFTNVDSKYYPLYLKPWHDFPTLHKRCHENFESRFRDKTLFPSAESITSLHDLLGIKEPLAGEDDVRLLQSFNVESCARKILSEYLAESNARLSPTTRESDTNQGKDAARLPLSVYFASSPYGIRLESPEDKSESQDCGTRPAYKTAILEAQQKDARSHGRGTGDRPPPAKRVSSPARKHRPGQWLIRINGDGSRVPVLVVEYKAAHKLRASTIKLALSGGDNNNSNNSHDNDDNNNTHNAQGLFAAAIREQMQNKIPQEGPEKDQTDAEKATARVLTQAFNYMVEFGLCYAYVASGEALILLYFDADDVRTLYYHLAVPREEVGTQPKQDLRLSEVSLVATLALLALDGPVLSQRWKKEAVERLKKWPDAYDEIRLLDESSEEEAAKNQKKTLRLSSRLTPQLRRRKDHDDDDHGGDGDFVAPKSSVGKDRKYETRSKGTSSGTAGGGTTTSTATRKHSPLPYCSQACLLGLLDGGPLDYGCPNVRLHRPNLASSLSTSLCGDVEDRHTLTAADFKHRMRLQLADDLDEDCDALDKFGKFGAIGMLFRLTLRGYGYCVVAKGVQRVHAPRLEREEAIYRHLHAQQGALVPVCLGTIELVDVYRTSVGAHISHMMLMSYAGEPMFSKAAGPMPDNIGSLEYDVWATLRQLGVQHGDEHEPNLLWNAAQRRLMCIDFEWAKLVQWKRKHERTEKG
ncbi:hypothetical protein SBRCBS47491_009549 [Sporothrix bragantina]|uniref:Metalloprotease m41 ftsh n=1 Tax=Sporothrix bragantina TaxID=671064 RepID=A0ABP0CVL6_9PEZI